MVCITRKVLVKIMLNQSIHSSHTSVLSHIIFFNNEVCAKEPFEKIIKKRLRTIVTVRSSIVTFDTV